MTTIKKFKFAALAALLSMGFGAQATTLALPDPSQGFASAHIGDFTVYSLELLAKCSAARDARCLPSGPFPVQSAPGAIDSQLVIVNGSGNTSNYPVPIDATKGDNFFSSPTGVSGAWWEMTAADEPGGATGTFTGDRIGTWEVTLGALVNYLSNPGGSIDNLVFIFGNNQQGSGENQFQYAWATAQVLNTAGAAQSTCYDLTLGNASYNGACTTTSPHTDYVPMETDVCIDKITGESYNLGTARNAGSCPATTAHPQGGYYVSNNIGQNAAEFAAYSASLEQYILSNYLANPDWVLSVNVRLGNLSDGGESLWICSDCRVGTQQVPEPGTLALVGLAAAGFGWARRRQARG